ncbi:MAG TPA: DNA primase [Flavobacteriaceae bacterium]|nr:DNA primase [Flavobacteriaceae bacterium]
MIAKSTIEKVFESSRVEEVIGDFVQLKKSGSNYKGLSPFTEERTPSFMVSPAKQIWKDFSSGKGGTVVTFLMEHEHFTYPEAIKYLAKKYNIEVEETQKTSEQRLEDSERESMYLITEYAKDYYQDNLLKSEEGKSIGLSYFKEREFTDEVIKKFQLGYSFNKSNHFSEEGLKKGYKLNFLEKTGLTIVKDDKNIDRFKGRVMFPILSMSGRVLGFGGRILKSSKNIAKYINSPESLIYYKNKVLYGIFQAKQSIVKEDNCFLVEGYTDVIKLHQKGIINVVASSGTALTENQIRLVSRLTKNITVLFDGDTAGSRAALRGIDIILEQGMNVRICNLPEGEDPDSFANSKQIDELKLFFKENSKDFIKYKASLLVDEADNDPVKKATVVRNMVESISKISDQIKKEIYIKECSSIMGISEQVLYSTLAQIQKKSFKKDINESKEYFDSFSIVKPDKNKKEINILYELEKRIIEILLLYGNNVEDFEDLILKEDENGKLVLSPIKRRAKVFEKIYMDLHEDEMEFSNENFKNIYYKIIECYNENKKIITDKFLNTLPKELEIEITNIMMNDEKYALHDWERNSIFPKAKDKTIPQLVIETILNLRCFLIDQKLNEFKGRTSTNKDNKSVLEDVVNFSNLKILLSRKLNRVI